MTKDQFMQIETGDVKGLESAYEAYAIKSSENFNWHYGAQGFESAAAAASNAKKSIAANDFIILYHKKLGHFAWAWPPEYGRTLLSESIVEVDYDSP